MTKKLKLSDLARDLHISTQELVGFYEQRDANGIKKKGVTGLTPEEINLALEHYSQKTQVENFEGYFASKNTPKPAEKKPTEKKPAEKKNSEKKPAEKKPADKKPQAEKKQPAPKNVEKSLRRSLLKLHRSRRQPLRRLRKTGRTEAAAGTKCRCRTEEGPQQEAKACCKGAEARRTAPCRSGNGRQCFYGKAPYR